MELFNLILLLFAFRFKKLDVGRSGVDGRLNYFVDPICVEWIQRRREEGGG